MGAFFIWSIYPQTYSKEQVIADVDKAIALMEEIHPDLYAVIDESTFDLKIDSLKTAMPPKVTESELYKIFGSITNYIGDAHTQLPIDFSGQKVRMGLQKSLPYRFRIKDNKIYLLKNYYIRNNIPVGSEILTINSKPAAQCLEEISKLISWETPAYRDAHLQDPYIWGIWNNFQNFEITYKTPENRIKSIITTSGLFSNLFSIWDFTGGMGLQSYQFKVLEGNIGYIDLKGFDDYERFQHFASTTFADIKQKNITDLIIDIRENGGGATSISEEIMQYISPVPYTSFDTTEVNLSHYLYKRLTPYSKKFMDSHGHKPGTTMFETNKKTPLDENPYRFSGKCYVLTDGYCFSTALDFPAMFRHFTAGQIIGQETGGRTVSFGSPIGVPLPVTGIMLKVSYKRFINVGGTPSEHGLIPDHVVEQTIADDIAGFDRVLNYTLSLISSQKR